PGALLAGYSSCLRPAPHLLRRVLHLCDVAANMIGALSGGFFLEKHLKFGQRLVLPVLLFVCLPSDVVHDRWMLAGQRVGFLGCGDGSVIVPLHVLRVSHQSEALAIVWIYA